MDLIVWQWHASWTWKMLTRFCILTSTTFSCLTSITTMEMIFLLHLPPKVEGLNTFTLTLKSKMLWWCSIISKNSSMKHQNKIEECRKTSFPNFMDLHTPSHGDPVNKIYRKHFGKSIPVHPCYIRNHLSPKSPQQQQQQQQQQKQQKQQQPPQPQRQQQFVWTAWSTATTSIDIWDWFLKFTAKAPFSPNMVPQLFRINQYLIPFLSHENSPLTFHWHPGCLIGSHWFHGLK